MPQKTESLVYKERVFPSLSFYMATLFLPFALFLVVLPFSEILAGFVALGSLLATFVISWITAPLIRISDTELRVGKVRISRVLIAAAEPVSKCESFSARGAELDTRAYVRFQVGVKELVKVQLQDSQDPTPYWLIATRQPEVVAAILNTAS